jgi:pimeloyl-ACP methyl ester carboxylesterase
MAATTGLAFIHGAGLGAWIWREVEPLISVPVLSLDYPHRDKGAVDKHLGLEDYSRLLGDRIKNWEPAQVILVAHSIGGVVALKIAARLGARVTGLIGISAAFPRGGGSYLSCLPFPQSLVMGAMVRLAGTRPPASLIKKGLCNDLRPDQADEVVKRYVAESTRLYTDRCEVPVPRMKSLYLKLGRDQAHPGNIQDRMAGNLETPEKVILDAGHLPMLGRPRELAGILNRFAG